MLPKASIQLSFVYFCNLKLDPCLRKGDELVIGNLNGAERYYFAFSINANRTRLFITSLACKAAALAISFLLVRVRPSLAN